jgi:hypothetical protein
MSLKKHYASHTNSDKFSTPLQPEQATHAAQQQTADQYHGFSCKNQLYSLATP